MTGRGRRPHVPRGEALRHAIRWLADQPHHDAATLEKAARRFDLSPLDEAFLLREFVPRKTAPPEN